MKKFFLILFFIFLLITPSFSATRNSYTQYGKHLMPTYYDPYFIEKLESCDKAEYVDWTGTYKYVIMGVLDKGICQYKAQYNPWLTKNKNEWKDYKMCYFNNIQLNELTVALKEHSNQISTYSLGAYKTTGTKLEYLLYSYEYHGACKLLLKSKKN